MPQSEQETHEQENIQVKPEKRIVTDSLRFSKVELLSIDSVFYFLADTVGAIPEGINLYKYNFVAGNSFVDSTGKPIHDRYHAYRLTHEQSEILRDSFLYNFQDDVRPGCLTTFRDVFLLYDDRDKLVQQVHVCFSCGEAQIYPFRESLWQHESGLNFKVLKAFSDRIKKEPQIHRPRRN